MSDQKTLSKLQLDKKRQKKHAGGRPRRVVFRPDQVEQMEKLAAVGMSEEQIAWVIGVSHGVLRVRLAEDRALAEAGKEKPDNCWTAVKRGRSHGDALLAKTAFDMATKEKNVSMLIFLAKTRLRWQEPAQDINVRNTVVFETQIGKDGVIRQQTLDAEWDEPKQIKGS